MSDLFEGQLMSRVGCLSCNHQTYAFDNFLDLSIDFPRKATRFTGTISLEDCFEKFIDLEKIIDAGYKCEGCKKPVNVEKDITLYRFPKLLVIHLKRFYHSAMRREKLNTMVTFPEKGLDMRKYAPHSSKLILFWLFVLEHVSRSKAIYDLYGVSHHSGSLYGGHYIW